MAEDVLAGGVDVVGMGTALAVDPELPGKWRSTETSVAAVELPPVAIRDKAVASAASMSRVRVQLRRLGKGRSPDPRVNPVLAFAADQVREFFAVRRYRAWLSGRSA